MSELTPTFPLCVKTPKGIEAVAQKAHGLPMRVRQVLIMVDGKRDAPMLATMFPGDGLQAILDQLLADGYIAPLKKEPPKASVPLPIKKPAPVDGPQPKDERERIEMARNFMVNTTRTFIGYVGSPLIKQVESCQSIEELQALFDKWRETINMNPEGARRMKELEPRLAALIS